MENQKPKSLFNKLLVIILIGIVCAFVGRIFEIFGGWKIGLEVFLMATIGYIGFFYVSESSKRVYLYVIWSIFIILFVGLFF